MPQTIKQARGAFRERNTTAKGRAIGRAVRIVDEGLKAALNLKAAMQAPARTTMNTQLLNFYEAIEQASADMLAAARDGNWDRVVKLEGACVLLISHLKHAAAYQPLEPEEMQVKARIMQRILRNDAELRYLAEPWLEDLESLLAGRPTMLH